MSVIENPVILAFRESMGLGSSARSVAMKQSLKQPGDCFALLAMTKEDLNPRVRVPVKGLWHKLP